MTDKSFLKRLSEEVVRRYLHIRLNDKDAEIAANRARLTCAYRERDALIDRLVEIEFNRGVQQ